MGHCKNFFVIEERNNILFEAYEFASANVDRDENPDGDYHGNLTIHDDIICDNYDLAVQKIEELDDGWYDDHAVQFRVYPEIVKTKKQLALEKRAEKNREDYKVYVEKHSLDKLKAKFISCRNCGSKINKSLLKGSSCPVCKNDLRADYVIERLKKYDNDLIDLRKSIKECQQKTEMKCKKQAKIMWLAKFEVHI